MLLHEITGAEWESERARYKVINLSTMADIEANSYVIINASVKTGSCRILMQDKTTKDFQLGEGGLRILPK